MVRGVQEKVLGEGLSCTEAEAFQAWAELRNDRLMRLPAVEVTAHRREE